jgi:hypothetical protein
MLYRHKQGTFEVCPYKATYTALVKQTEQVGTETIELEDGTTTEIPTYAITEVEEQRENYVHDKELFELTLQNSSQPHKDLSYENVILSDDQQQRYEEIRSLPESAIGHCMEYVIEGTFPEGNNHPLRHIQIEQENRKLGQELSEREINEIIQGMQLSDLEIQILELKLGGI